MNNFKSETAIVYKSHYDMIFNMNIPTEMKLKMLEAILACQLENKLIDIKFDDINIQYMWQPIMKSYEASMRRRIASQSNGKLGGRPKKVQESVQNAQEYNCTTQEEKVQQKPKECEIEGVSDIVSTPCVEPIEKEVDEREIIDEIKEMISDGNGGISADGTSVVHDNIGYLCSTYNITEEDVYKRDGYYSRAINEIKNFKHEEAILPF